MMIMLYVDFFLLSCWRTDGLFFFFFCAGIGRGERNLLHARSVLSRHWEYHRLIGGFFPSGPATDLGIRATLIEQHSAPEILVHGLVKPEDVEKLFEMYASMLLSLCLNMLTCEVLAFINALTYVTIHLTLPRFHRCCS